MTRFLLALFVLVCPLFGAIALDTTTDGGLANPATSLTFTHTTTGSNLILFVSCFGDVSNDADAFTGITYNSVALTLIGKTNPTGDRWVYLWYLIGPTTGSHNVVVSTNFSSAIDCHAASYTGVSQSGQPDASVTNSNTSVANGSDYTTTITVVAANSWTIIAGRINSGSGITAGSGTTTRQSGSNGLYTADSNGALSAGSTSLILHNGSGSSVIAGSVMASFKPVGTSTPYTMLMRGVGE